MAKKAKKASSQAVFEDALEKLVVEMNVAVWLRGGAQRDVKVDCRYRMLRRHVSAASQCGARVEAGAEGCDGAESRVLEARGAGRG